MEQDLISVVIPVYNVEKYFKRCIDSVLKQTYQNMEIIIVDDGSKDSSGSLCDEYEKKDSRIAVFHKENGGLSSARNFGLEKALGRYICFIDSDDFIDENYITIMYNKMIKSDADICYCKSINFTDETKINLKVENEKTVIIDKEEAIKQLLLKNGLIKNYIPHALYKKVLFDNIRFPVGSNFEDIATTYKILDASKKIIVTNKILYYYFINDNGITQKMKKQDIIDRFNNMNEREKFINQNYPRLKNISDRYMFRIYLVIIKDLIKNYFPEIINDSFFIDVRNRIINMGIKEVTLKNLIIYMTIKINTKNSYSFLHKIVGGK